MGRTPCSGRVQFNQVKTDFFTSRGIVVPPMRTILRVKSSAMTVSLLQP